MVRGILLFDKLINVLTSLPPPLYTLLYSMYNVYLGDVHYCKDGIFLTVYRKISGFPNITRI